MVLARMMLRLSSKCAATVLAVCLAASAAEREKPVAFIAKSMFTQHTPAGDASIPIETSVDLTTAHPEMTRAALIFHGKGRDAEGYFHDLERAASDAGESAHTILIAPQFLREEDVQAHHLPSRMLRWHLGSWTAGLPAAAPQPLSTFQIVDALLRVLGDRRMFPNLKRVVLFGHSGGGQLLNRYAIVGREPQALSAAGIHVRFVIANPSSYFYFSDERPRADGSLAAFDRERCPRFDRWRYGPEQAPPYVEDTSARAWDERESAYARADVVYLLGTADTDPAQADLDTSCAGEAQGAERFERGKAYFRYLRSRHPLDFQGRLWFVPDVGHTGRKMVESACGIAAIFDSGTNGLSDRRDAGCSAASSSFER